MGVGGVVGGREIILWMGGGVENMSTGVPLVRKGGWCCENFYFCGSHSFEPVADELDLEEPLESSHSCAYFGMSRFGIRFKLTEL